MSCSHPSLPQPSQPKSSPISIVVPESASPWTKQASSKHQVGKVACVAIKPSSYYFYYIFPGPEPGNTSGLDGEVHAAWLSTKKQEVFAHGAAAEYGLACVTLPLLLRLHELAGLVKVISKCLLSARSAPFNSTDLFDFKYCNFSYFIFHSYKPPILVTIIMFGVHYQMLRRRTMLLCR